MSWLGYNKKALRGLKKPPKPGAQGAPQELKVVTPPKAATAPKAPPPPKDDGREVRLYDVKRSIHHLLLERLDLSQMEDLYDSIRAKEIRTALVHLLEESEEPLNIGEKSRLARELEFEILGLGPREQLLADPGNSA